MAKKHVAALREEVRELEPALQSPELSSGRADRLWRRRAKINLPSGHDDRRFSS